jgi:hypothetical protein
MSGLHCVCLTICNVWPPSCLSNNMQCLASIVSVWQSAKSGLRCVCLKICNVWPLCVCLKICNAWSPLRLSHSLQCLASCLSLQCLAPALSVSHLIGLWKCLASDLSVSQSEMSDLEVPPHWIVCHFVCRNGHGLWGIMSFASDGSRSCF